ncbi:MAG: glutamate ligase domain-containing protein, partial [Methanosarcinales archaeon]
AALTVARALKIPDKISFEALSEYKGSWRRFELIEAELRGMIRGKTRKIIIVNDYAHHPTNIRVTLKAAREKFPKKEIWAVFQPHQYQRTHYLFDDFVKVLKEALRPAQGKPQVDKLIITDIFTVAGREKKEIKKKVSSEKLVKAINKRTVHKKRTTVRRLCQAEYIPNIDKVARYLKRNLRGGEVVIIMGAGDIYKLASILVKW